MKDVETGERRGLSKRRECRFLQKSMIRTIWPVKQSKQRQYEPFWTESSDFGRQRVSKRDVRRGRHNVHILLREVSCEKERYSCKKWSQCPVQRWKAIGVGSEDIGWSKGREKHRTMVPFVRVAISHAITQSATCDATYNRWNCSMTRMRHALLFLRYLQSPQVSAKNPMRPAKSNHCFTGLLSGLTYHCVRQCSHWGY